MQATEWLFLPYAARSISTPKNPRFRLFITDDDSEDRELLIEALGDRAAAIEILEFTNGEKLLSHLSKIPKDLPDIFVIDLNMPIMDGYETLEALRSEKDLDRVPIIILTTSGHKKDELRCYELGCTHFFKKPFGITGYLPLVDIILSHWI